MSDEQWANMVLGQVLLAGSVLCTFPAFFVLVETLFARKHHKREKDGLASPIDVAVVIPAHNEEIELGTTLQALRHECTPTTRILVVADHCSDHTARIARTSVVDVIERNAPSKRGKSYALADGVRALRDEPPDVVVFVDADCRFAPGGLQRLVDSVHRNQQPEQSVYLMESPGTSSFHGKLSAFAFQFKNEIRAKGLAAMHAPCQLTGSGMAFPWKQICNLPLESQSLVEDLELGILLATRGTPAFLCSDAKILSQLPHSRDAALRQRRRWEHGYMRSAIPGAVRLLWAAARHRDPKIVLLALDLCIPPLSFLSIAICLGWLLSLVAALMQLAPWTPWMQWNLAALLLCAAITIAVATTTDSPIRVIDLLKVPRYLTWKLPIALTLFYRPERKWQRTDRTPKIHFHKNNNE